MSKINDWLDNNLLFRYFVIILGMIISSVGINQFLTPAGLLGGGVSGLAVAMNHFFGLNVGIATLIINIPVFILGFIYLEKEFCITSLINTLLFSVILGVTSASTNLIPLDDVFIQTIYGGILVGTGFGFVFKAKSSLGGVDIISAILKIKLNIPIESTTIMVNIIVVLLGGYLFGLKLALYTLIGIFINTKVMVTVKDIMNSQQSIMLISEKCDAIAVDIMNEFKRGVTFLHGEGAYSGEDKKIIYCIVNTNEIPKIKDIALKHDSNSFLTINQVSEVRGSGFREKFL